MKKLLICLCCFLFPLISFAAIDDVKTLKETIGAMTSTWNQGDLNTFLSYYKDSSDDIFVSSKIINGFKKISERYESEYPANDVMGKLSISDLKVKVLSPQYAMTVGNWSQEREDTGKTSGSFSLLWEKTQAGWKIVVDHTS